MPLALDLVLAARLAGTLTCPLSVHEAGSSLTLPVRPAAAPDDVPLAPFGRPGWDVRVETRTILTSDGTDFHVDATLDGYEDGRRVFSRTWKKSVPRVNV